MTDNKTEYIENLIKQDYRDWQESSYCDELSDICNTSCTAYNLGICPHRGIKRVTECERWEGSIAKEKGRYPTPKELGWKITNKL